MEVFDLMSPMTHQVLASLLREHSELAKHLLQIAIKKNLPKQMSLRKRTDLHLPNYSADAVYTVEDGRDRERGVVIFDIQLEPIAKQRSVWFHFVITCHCKLDKPVTLIAIALTEEMAQWCAEPLLYDSTGKNTFCPAVLGPKEIPRITDPKQAKALPPLAFLSVSAHGKGPEAIELGQAALRACATLPVEEGALFADFVMSQLSSTAQRALEKVLEPKNHSAQSGLAERKEAQARNEGNKRVA